MDFPEIDPIALELGPLVIRWYALAYLAGFLLGWQYALFLAEKVIPQHRPTRQEIDDFLVWAIIAVILGGRLGYVVFYNPGFYMDNPLSALQIWKGGMAFHGGALGVGLALFLFARKHMIPLFRLSDIIACVTPIGLFFGRIANFINSELYGRQTDLPWGIVFPGTEEPRHPSQLYEAALEGFLLFVILAVLVRGGILKRYPGIISGAFLCLYGIFRFMIEYVRQPDEQIGLLFDFISMGQVLSLPMILLGASLIAYTLIQQRRISDHVCNNTD